MQCLAWKFLKGTTEVSDVSGPLFLALPYITSMSNSHCPLHLDCLSILEKCFNIWIITPSASCSLLPKEGFQWILVEPFREQKQSRLLRKEVPSHLHKGTH